MLMAIGSRRSDWELTPLKAGASPSLLSGREPKTKRIFLIQFE